MKTIVLIRHSKAEDITRGQKDIERKLRKRGLHDSALIANRLKGENVVPDMIISSPAVRAIETAESIANVYGFDAGKIVKEEFIYKGYTSGEFVSYINTLPDSVGTVFAIGHNPELGMLAINLTNNSIFYFPTTATVVVDFECDKWVEVESREGKARTFLYPKLFKHENDD